MSDCFMGEVRMFAGSYAPEDWILCNGQALNVQQMNALFSLLGTTFGGDGVATFNAPDLRGSLPVGQGTNNSVNPPLTPRTIGQSAGEELHTLTAAEMPAHTHPVYVVNSNATTTTPYPGVLYGAVQPVGTQQGLYTQSVPPQATIVQLDTIAVSSAGLGGPHINVMITTAISFIMALNGYYPTRPN